jgi:hypothetical protein
VHFLVVAHPDSNTMKANVVNIVFIVFEFKVLILKGSSPFLVKSG